MKTILFFASMLLLTGAFAQSKKFFPSKEFEVSRSDAEWKKQLSPDAYVVLRQKGTERAFTGAYYDNHEEGVYYCGACGNELFSSAHKFDSGTGWPSFYKPLAESRIIKESDVTHGMSRTEVMCSRCGGHLGHVFDDGPEPTGLRFCINSVALTFKKK
jgi:peptide-methionine (R)-S-oxide reductase